MTEITTAETSLTSGVICAVRITLTRYSIIVNHCEYSSLCNNFVLRNADADNFKDNNSVDNCGQTVLVECTDYRVAQK